METKYHVVYHAPCSDGQGAAAVAFHFLGDEAIYEACNYGKARDVFVDTFNARLHPIDGTATLTDLPTLIVLDFSFNLAQLQILSRRYKEIIILDHHKTAREELMMVDPTENLHGWVLRSEIPDNVELIFDMSRSGIMLAWDYFSARQHPNISNPRPMFVNYLGSRDLWQHKGTTIEATCEALHLALMSAPFDIQKWEDYLIDENCSAIIERGAAIRQFFFQKIDDVLKYAIEFEFYTVVNAPYFMASDVGDKLTSANPNKYAIIWSYGKDGVVVSLRSKGDIDVSAIAKQYGGGGHKNAAGCKFAEIGDFFYTFMND